jgi:putative ABC transport system ATP-binding protein
LGAAQWWIFRALKARSRHICICTYFTPSFDHNFVPYFHFMLKAQALTFAYPGGTPMHFPEIHCRKGEHWLLLGASGSGKTTLLQLLAGLRTPTAGTVEIGDTAMSSLSRAKLDKFRGQHIGIIFQQPHFIESLNVEENLVLAQGLAGKKTDRSKIRGLLNRLGMVHKLKSKTTQLSQGEQQRIAIARALVNEPAVILADEPTSALDDQNTREVIALLEEQAQLAGATLLCVTHDARLKDYFPKQIVL